MAVFGTAVFGTSIFGTGVTYWVSTSGSDAAAGTFAAPFRTIAHAAGLVNPGDSVRVLPGSYGETVTINRGGTAGSRVQFISDTKWAAITSGFLIRRNPDTVATSGGAYTDVIGFEITGGSQAWESDCSFASVIGCKIHDGGGIHTYQAPWPTAGTTNHYPTVGCIIDGNLVYSVPNATAYLAGSPGAAHGIYLEGEGDIVRNNLVFRCQGWGITWWHTGTAGVCVNNVCIDNGAGGIEVGATVVDFPSAAPVKYNDFTVVNNNICVHNGYGSSAGNPYGGATTGRYGIDQEGYCGTHNEYHNNILYQNHPDDTVALGFAPSAPSGSQGGGAGTVTSTLTSDPLFVNYQADGSGDYRLQASSPGINAGTSASAPASDYAGVSRPQGVGFDIGAYEAQSQVITFATTVGGLPYDTSQVPAYEAEAGRHFSFLHWFQPWQDGGVIQGWNQSYVDNIVAGDRLPLMTLEAWDVGNQAINPYPITSIAAGSFDNQIRDWWAVPIRNWGKRLLLRPFHEMNGNWYPWCYQAVLSPGNTAAQIIAAWKRVVDVFRANGANNVEWVWCPNFDISGSWPPSVSVFYPGDSYVDWLAVDAYNNNDPFDTLTNKLTPVYNQIIALNATKPFMIPEWGCKEGSGANDKATWVTNSAGEWRSFPRISAACYFNSGPWAFATGNAASRTSALATFPFAPYDIPAPLPSGGTRGPLVTPVAATTAGGSGVTSLPCNVPAGVLNGDLLIAFVTRYASTPNAVTGWTRLADYSTGTAGDADTTVSVFYRTAASEPGSYTFTAPATGSNWFSIEMTAYRNVAAALWDVTAVSATGNSNVASVPSMTTVTDRSIHLAHWSSVPHMNGVPAGYTADNPVSDSGVATAHKQITPASATGTLTQNLGFAGTWVGIGLAIRPKLTGAYAAAVVGDGALGFYRLQETSGTVAADSGYGGNAGTISATGITYDVTPAPVADAGARCFTFNGTSGYIDLGNPAAFQLSNVTLATWIKTSNADGLTHGVFVKATAWGLFMNANHFATYDWTGAAWRDTGVAINDGAWHLLQMSVQSGVSNGTKLYIDGVLKLTTTLTVSAQTKNLLIGAGDVAGGFPQYWGGQLAEPSITVGVIA